MDQLRAVMFVPTGLELLSVLARLNTEAERRGWRPTSYTRSWDELVRLLAGGHAEIGVAGSREHLPPDRIPRLVVLDEESPPEPNPTRPVIRW